MFTGGRFSTKASYTSYFEHVTCRSKDNFSLKQCSVVDGCQSTCETAVGIKCYSMSSNKITLSTHNICRMHFIILFYTEPQTCNDGDIRLMDGTIIQEGRIEICYNNIWGSVCGDGFDFSDAYVACKAFGVSGIS